MLGEDLVERRDAGTRVDQEQRQIGLVDGALRLPAHARSRLFVAGFFEPGGIDEGQAMPQAGPAWRRSRVTPGLSSTRASSCPTSRLNRVDLPTLGRPTIATVRDIASM